MKLTFATKPASALFLDEDIDAAMSWLGVGEENALERRGQNIRGNPDFTPEDSGGPWVFLELRQHYSVLPLFFPRLADLGIHGIACSSSRSNC